MKSRQLETALAMGVACAVMAGGCASGTDGVHVDGAQREALAALGVVDAVVDDAGFALVSETGSVGALTQDGRLFAVSLDGVYAQVHRGDAVVSVLCGTSESAVEIALGSDFAGAVEASGLDDSCARLVSVTNVLGGLDQAHDPSCEVTAVGADERLACGAEPSGEADVAGAREALLEAPGGGSTCTCAGDGWGFCPAECWSCSPNACDPWGGGGGDWDGGGGGGGGGTPADACDRVSYDWVMGEECDASWGFTCSSCYASLPPAGSGRKVIRRGCTSGWTYNDCYQVTAPCTSCNTCRTRYDQCAATCAANGSTCACWGFCINEFDACKAGTCEGSCTRSTSSCG